MWDKTSLTMNDCVIGPSNIVTVAGGGIANGGGTLILNRSTVSGNHGTGSLGGAGIVTYNRGTTTLINSTVSGNVTNNYGGGIFVAYESTVNLIHSTVTNNTANEDYLTQAYGGVGGIHNDGGTVSIQNSLIAGNVDKTASGHAKWPDVHGAFSSLGGNLIGDGTGSTGWTVDDLVGTGVAPIDPKLGPLALNGPGLTFTHALLADSPAIDAVACPAGITIDQRGVNSSARQRL